MDLWRNKQLEYTFRRGFLNKYKHFSECTADALEFCCITFNAHINSNQKNVLTEEYAVLPVFPDVEIGLQKLKELKHRLFAFSNGNTNTLASLLSNAKIINYFD